MAVSIDRTTLMMIIPIINCVVNTRVIVRDRQDNRTDGDKGKQDNRVRVERKRVLSIGNRRTFKPDILDIALDGNHSNSDKYTYNSQKNRNRNKPHVVPFWL